MIRNHGAWRRNLFTPYRIQKGPEGWIPMRSKRVIIGEFRSGGKFRIEDEWKNKERAHSALKEDWRGKTVFEEEMIRIEEGAAADGDSRPM